MRASFLVAGFLFLSGAFSPTLAAANPVPEPGNNTCPASCYPALTCDERVQRLKAHKCPLPVVTKTVNDCDEQDRKIGALKAQIDARPVKCPPPVEKTTTVEKLVYLEKKPVGSWLVGPTAGYADGPFLGLAGGYQFAKGPLLLGTLTRHRLDGGGVWYTPPPCPHEESKDPLVPYPSENVTGLGVTVLFRLP